MSRKVCAIVGVGPGLGMAIARRFGREGFALALVARNPDTLLGLRDVLRAEGHEAVAFRADAASPSDLERALTEVAETLGHPAVLVYNAAAPRRGTPTTLAPEVLVEDFRVDVVGALAAVRTVVPRMKARGEGTILLTGGGFALHPVADQASLSVGKAALRSLALCLAEELAPCGIHAATVTVSGFVAKGTTFDPDAIAETFVELHHEPKGSFRSEAVFRG